MNEYNLIKNSLQDDGESTLRILDKCYQEGLKLYQRLTTTINRKLLSPNKIVEAEETRESIKNNLNEILESCIALRLKK
jgi:hypothetical protein